MCHLLYDVGNALARHAGLFTAVYAALVQLIELRQARLVHAVHHTELSNQEIDQRCPVSHWSVLLTSLIDFLVRL